MPTAFLSRMGEMNKFPSKYSNGKTVSPAQYLSELICERLALRMKKDLHYRFWLNKEWEKEYKGQIATANKLLRKYDIKDIIDALNTYTGKKIYSLRAPHLLPIIDQMAKREKKIENTEKIIERNFLDTGKQHIKKLNLLDKLKEIDDGSTR